MSPEMAVLEANDARQAAALAMPEQAFASPLAAQQTYPQSPMQQLAAKIDRALIPTHIAASGIASGANTTDSIKVLTVQLEPRELGQVRLRLTLSEGVLQVRVEAQDAQTAKMLLDQSGVLQRLLGFAGYAVDSLTVQQQALPPTPNQSLENPSRHETARCIAESGHPGAGSGSQQHHAASQRNESSFDPQQQGFADETGTASGASDVRGGNGSHLRGSGIYV
jgi:chemotaxis protein MotD